MLKIVRFWGFALFIASALMVTGPSSGAENEAAVDENTAYRIHPGDTLLISVWREENLQREVIVRPDGGLSFPLVNDLQAAGKTLEELRAELTERLGRFIPDPVVTVEARQLLGNKIYVIGKVNRPGEFPVNRNVDVVQALAMAGGMTPYAAVNKIKILRRSGDGTLAAIPFEYGDIEKGENLEQNIVLQAGDVVVVP
ncbi:MAG TPA: polysaccharide export protein [Methylothermaceae bacterium]|nr:polysaccharide export protein [Methylothermaceae bacterium]